MKTPSLLDVISAGALIAAITALCSRRSSVIAARPAGACPERRMFDPVSREAGMFEEVQNRFDLLLQEVEARNRKYDAVIAEARDPSFGAFRAFVSLWRFNRHTQRATVWAVIILLLVSAVCNLSLWLETSLLHMPPAPGSSISLANNFAGSLATCGVIVLIQGLSDLWAGLLPSLRETDGPLFRKASQVTLSIAAALFCMAALCLLA